MRRFGIAGLLVIAAAVFIGQTGVLANDTIAREATGGIELTKSHIRMLKEVLEISPHQIHVSYRFVNESDQDIQAIVTLPLPLEQTTSLEMTFPAGKEMFVEHSYVPVTGAGRAGLYQRESVEDLKKNIAKLWHSFTGKADDDEDCLDEMTKLAIEDRVKEAVSKGSESVVVSHNSVEYPLGTGHNWKGPIGEFTLRLKKEKPEDFVSLCFPGKPKKVSPTVYEFHEKDFVPPDKLVVYFYSVGPEVTQ